MPTKTTYRVGEAFDGTGLVVTATYADDTTENVTGYCTFSPSVMAAGTTQVTITYETVIGWVQVFVTFPSV